ncbi:probable E3 ubiquitin-protein ligase RHY1A [Oryza glaberrima]|uniref:probable E3 ubiquitin-protein ligase RHY1A n=1 Tax=Oryza glaberrima TaxID=4538 RepID=UPI00224C1590|nr:probable E3 ubiquitin-protein ligase RHY1A [Oryza glaberrima]
MDPTAGTGSSTKKIPSWMVTELPMLSTEANRLPQIPSWMIRKPLMLCMEAGRSGKAATADAMEQSCSVCLKNFEKDDCIWSMPCSHTFHQLCILGDRSCRVCHPAAPPSTDEKPEAPRTMH